MDVFGSRVRHGSRDGTHASQLGRCQVKPVAGHAVGMKTRRSRLLMAAFRLNPALQSWDVWLGANASRIPLG
jgi:hypothetical protein